MDPEVKSARADAYSQISPEFESKDKRDIVFLLTLGNMAESALKERPNVKEYLQYMRTSEGQREILSLAREFDLAIIKFNQTAGSENIDPSLINTMAVRSENKLGLDGTIPPLLGNGTIRPHDAIREFEAGEETLADQNRYMDNSERAKNDERFLEEIRETGKWSRLHLDARSPKHFLATLIIDLYPGMLRRTGRYKELDTDELVKALCESLEPKSEFFRLIKEQGWFTEDEFSGDFVKEANRFNGKVRSLKKEDLDSLKPILATWIKDRRTGQPLPDEVEEDLQLMSESVEGKNDRMYLVAEDLDGEILGVVGFKTPDETMFTFTKTSNPAELVNAYVKSDKIKGRGVGRSLIAKLEEMAREKGHTEIVLNSGPRYKDSGWGFYDKLEGYKRVGIAVGYYGENVDAPVWRKEL